MIFDLVGIGAGPFNLSLGILLKDTALKSLFLDKKQIFLASWNEIKIYNYTK